MVNIYFHFKDVLLYLSSNCILNKYLTLVILILFSILLSTSVAFVVMQTCPNCCNVLVSSQTMCCSHLSSSVNSTQVSNQSCRGSQLPLLLTNRVPDHSVVVSPTTEVKCLCDNRKVKSLLCPKASALCSLPTPQVSGHLFHFPTASNDLVHHFDAACQLTCHVTCTTHMSNHSSTLTPCVDSSLNKNLANVSCSFSCSVGTCNSPIVDDVAYLEASRKELNLSGWYWTHLTWQEAEVVLQETCIGTFLVRDSADPRHCFSMSVQTEKGPTSVRIHYLNGKFRLSGQPSVKASLPEFNSVIKLVEYYISTNEKYSKSNHVWIDSSGKVFSPIRIRQPLLKGVPSLKHLSRKASNFYFSKQALTEQLPLPLWNYIEEYPYWC